MIFKEIFKVDKPIIGDIHLLPLPGSPKHNNSLEEILERAISEAKIYTEGGINGIIVENYGDVPYYPDKVGSETVAAMTYIACEISKEVKIPVGIQVLRNDAQAAISIANAIDGKFIRVNVLAEERVCEDGSIMSKAYDLQRFRKLLGAEDVKILADIEHYALPYGKTIIDIAEDLTQRDLADAIIISGGFTGRKPDIRDIERLKQRRTLSDTPILVGGGINKDNVQGYLRICDGIIIATSLKVGGISTNPVDPERVKEFMKKVNEVR